MRLFHTPPRPARILTTVGLVTLVLCVSLFLVPVAGAAVPTSAESTTTAATSFIGRGNQVVAVADGLNRSQIVALLTLNYGTAKPSLTGLTFVIDGAAYKLTKAELASITPAAINFTLLADAIFTNAETSPGTSLDANNLIAQMINGTALDKIVATYRDKSQLKAKDISYVYSAKKKGLTYALAKNGLRITNTSGRAALLAALRQFAAQGYQGAVTTASVPRSVTYPTKTTKKQMGKAILVRKSSRKLFLYDKGKVVRTYRVAVGMRGYGTPSGDYYIGTKRPKPTWSNPGSAWAKSMPKSIPPGASNPLGLRAMNLHRAGGGDTGYRIHGTSNIRSIGTAASHGCIRVANGSIVKLYKLTPLKTPVFIR